MKKYCWLICLLLFLSACAVPDAVSSTPDETASAAQQEESPPPTEEIAEEPLADGVYHAIKGSYAWLRGGGRLAVQDGATVRYIGLDNTVLTAVTLPDSELPDSYRLLFADDRILAAGDSADPPSPITLCRIDGEWLLANAAIFDGSGELLQSFPAYTQLEEQPGVDAFGALSDGRTVVRWEDTCIPEPVWISGDLLALHTRSRLFFYRLSTGKLTLADDMSDWMEPYGKMQAYYGVDRILPYGEGCYYFVHRNEELSNRAGSVWFADEGGARELFAGQEFASFGATDQSIVLLDWLDGEAGEMTRVFHVRIDREELVQLAELEGGYTWGRVMGSFLSLQNTDQSAFYLIGPLGSMELLQPSMPGYDRFDLLGVRDDGILRQYLYAAHLDGEPQYYLVSGSEIHHLSTQPYLFGDEQYHRPMTHFIERRFDADNPYHAVGVRVRPMERIVAEAGAAPSA